MFGLQSLYRKHIAYCLYMEKNFFKVNLDFSIFFFARAAYGETWIFFKKRKMK